MDKSVVNNLTKIVPADRRKISNEIKSLKAWVPSPESTKGGWAEAKNKLLQNNIMAKLYIKLKGMQRTSCKQITALTYTVAHRVNLNAKTFF